MSTGGGGMSKSLGKLLQNLLPRPFEQMKIPSGSIDSHHCCSEYIIKAPEESGLHFSPSYSLDPEALHWKDAFYSSAQELWCFDKATVDSGACLVSEAGLLIEDLSERAIQNVNQNVNKELHPKFHFHWSNLFRPTHYKKKRIFNLAHQNDTNPYYWLLNAIARLSLIDQVEVDALYVPYRTAYQRESLAIAMQKLSCNLPIINSLQLQDLKAEKIYTPSYGYFDKKRPLAPAKWACDAATSLLGAPSQERIRRIYISRSDADYRRILNEDALIDLLRRRGFESIVMSELSFKEHRALFAQSEAIISAHGAALAHLLFCAEGTKVLEIFYPQYMPLRYLQMSTYRNLEYAFCLGEPLDSSDKHWPREDIFVDLGKVKRILDMLKLN